MAGFNRDQAVAYMSGRLQAYAIICAYNVGGVIANVALVANFGPGAPIALKAAIALAIIAVAVISVMTAQSVFDDMAAIRKDRLPDMEDSHFMAMWDASPIGLFGRLTAGFNALIAAVQLWALFSV